MFSSTTITSVGLTLSALLLSAIATPLQARDAAFVSSPPPFYPIYPLTHFPECLM